MNKYYSLIYFIFIFIFYSCFHVQLVTSINLEELSIKACNGRGITMCKIYKKDNFLNSYSLMGSIYLLPNAKPIDKIYLKGGNRGYKENFIHYDKGQTYKVVASSFDSNSSSIFEFDSVGNVKLHMGLLNCLN